MGNDYCCNFLIDVMLVVEILGCVPQNILKFHKDYTKQNKKPYRFNLNPYDFLNLIKLYPNYKLQHTELYILFHMKNKSCQRLLQDSFLCI